MAELPRLLRVVAASEALPAAPRSARDELARILLAEARAPALRGWRRLLDCAVSGSRDDPGVRARLELVRRWSWLQALERVSPGDPIGLDSRGGWRQAVLAAAADSDPSVRVSAAMAAGALGAGLEVCIALLEDADAAVGREAERTLVAAARQLAESAAADREVEDVVARAAARFAEHRRHGAMLAAVFLLDPVSLSRGRRALGGSDARPAGCNPAPLGGCKPAPLALWALGPTDDGHGAIRSALRKANHPLARRRAIEWLAWDPMAAAAIDRLNRARDREEHEVALVAWALTLHPRRRARLAMIRPRPGAADGPIPRPQVAQSLSESARVGLCHWLAHVRLTDEERRTMAERAIADPSPRVRWAALQAASAAETEDFAFDRDGRIARSALLRLSGVGEPRAERAGRGALALRRAQRLARHPDAHVRRIADSERARLDPWEAPTAAAACVRARRLLAEDREALLCELRERIVRGPAPGRVRAIALAGRLEVAWEVEEALLESWRSAGPAALAALDGDARAMLERIGATAVKAMGALVSEASREALQCALRHTSARIRANALEALAQRARRSNEREADVRRTLIELKADSAHRVRANAIGALMRGVGGPRLPHVIYEPGAAEALGAMLGDDRPMHRIAGLWATQRLLVRCAGAGLGRQWTPLAARLADVARSDSDPRARIRAAACIRALQFEVRAGWRGRAPNVLSTETTPAALEVAS